MFSFFKRQQEHEKRIQDLESQIHSLESELKEFKASLQTKTEKERKPVDPNKLTRAIADAYQQDDESHATLHPIDDTEGDRA